MYRPNLYAEKPKPVANGEAAPAPDDKLVKQYWREIERYKRATSDWHEQGEQIERLYLDEDRTQASARRFALLWANVETLKPAVYAKPPVVMCSRRYKDRDPIARIAAELMERATNTSFDLYNVDETFQMVRDDRLLPGRGQAWVRYEADIEQYEGNAAEGDADTYANGDEPGDATDPTDDVEPTIHEKIAGERVCTDYVHWTDFGHNVAGAWNDVWLVWRATYKTKDEVADRFGEKRAEELTYDAKAPASMSDKSASSMGENAEDFCKIIEVWDKRRKLTSWISEGLKGQFIESGPPPVNFSNFFPCPKPCYATKTSKSLIPRPDYIYYRDQAKEINDLTAKISNMTEWLVVKGFVPGAPSRVSDALEEVIRDKGNTEMFTQVESWTEWTEKGGIAKLIDWMPVDMIIKTIQAAIQARTQLIQDVFQITGLSDILRGQTDPTETLGAQELKAQTGSRRLKNTKDEVARFCRDIARLNAEIIAEKFEPESIAAITGYRYQPPAPPPISLPGLGAPIASNILPMIHPGVPLGIGSFGGGGSIPQAPAMPPQGMAQGHGAAPPAPDAMAPAMAPGAPPTVATPSPPVMPQPQAMPPQMPGAPQQPMGMDANQQQGPDMVFDDRVMKLLRDDRLRSFRVDVETDSTAQADEQAEKQSRTEFLNATGQYMDKAVQAIQLVPETASLMGEALMYVVRGFRAGRSLEEDIERTFGQLAQKAMAASQQPKPPDPEQVKAQAAAQALQQKTAQDAQMHGQAMQQAQMRHDQDSQAAAQKVQATAQQSQQQMAQAAQAHEQAMQAAALKQQADQALADEKMRQMHAEAERSVLEHHMRMAEFDRQSQVKAQADVANQGDAELKQKEFDLKDHDTRSRLSMDQDEQKARRSLESEQMKGEGGKTAKAEIEDSVKQQIQELAAQFADSMNELSQNQVKIVSVLQDIKGNQDEMTQAMTSVVGHMTAPRTVKRDGQGRAIGVEVGQSNGDLRAQLEKLTAGGRQIRRDKTGRVEAFD